VYIKCLKTLSEDTECLKTLSFVYEMSEDIIRGC